jgi:gliding motility-associated-like protein
MLFKSGLLSSDLKEKKAGENFSPAFFINCRFAFKTVTILSIILSRVLLLSAQNLVMNPSFEENGFCDGTAKDSRFFAKNWIMLNVGYVNSCINSINNGFGVPENLFGYQLPKSGNSYICLYTMEAGENTPIYRSNLILGKLFQPLESEKEYYIRFYVNRAFGKVGYVVTQDWVNYKPYYKNFYSINSISLCLTKDSFSLNDTIKLNNLEPQINNPATRVLNDTLNWISISGIYKARGDEQFITIGNFLPKSKLNLYLQASKDTFPTDSFIDYFIDDVSVLPLPHFPKDTYLCAGESLRLETHLPGFVHQWQDGSTDSVYTISQEGTYRVNIQLDSAYSYSDTITVHFSTRPEIVLPRVLKICQGEKKKIPLPGIYRYVWENGKNDSTREFSAPGTYILQTINHACMRMDTLKVIIDSPPAPPLPADTFLCEGIPLELHVSSAYPLFWQDGSISSSYAVSQPGNYSLTIVNECGKFIFPILVEEKNCEPVAYFPNAFTPNNDSLNERFTIYGENIQSAELYIYNRWGELIFHASDKEPSWNGTVNGAPASEGVYYYIARIKGITGYKNSHGVFTVIR